MLLTTQEEQLGMLGLAPVDRFGLVVPSIRKGFLLRTRSFKF